MKSFRIFSSISLAIILLLSAVTIPGYFSDNNIGIAQAETFGVVMDDNKDYITFNSKFPNKIDAVTISAVVAPDLDDGSSVFTIVGKNEAFALYINRSVDPDNRATLAVYDGMKWHNVISKSKIIDGEMVHIVGTFGDSSISIYINGEHEATVSDIDVRKIIKGKMLTGPLSYLYSDYEISIGAFTNLKKNQVKVSKEFAGIIYTVDLFEKTLDKSEVKELYLKSFDIKEFSEGLDIAQEAATEIKNTQRTINTGDSDNDDTKNYQVKQDTSEPKNTNKVFDNSDSGGGGPSNKNNQNLVEQQNKDSTGNDEDTIEEFSQSVTLISASDTGADSIMNLSERSQDKIQKDIEKWNDKANHLEEEANNKNDQAEREDSKGNHNKADNLREEAKQLLTEANLLRELANHAQSLLDGSGSGIGILQTDESNGNNGVQDFSSDVTLISASSTQDSLSIPNIPEDSVDDYKELIEQWLKQAERKEQQAKEKNDEAEQQSANGNDEKAQKLRLGAQELLLEANYLREMADYLQGLLDGEVILFTDEPPVIIHVTLEEFLSNLQRITVKYTELYGTTA